MKESSHLRGCEVVESVLWALVLVSMAAGAMVVLAVLKFCEAQ